MIRLPIPVYFDDELLSQGLFDIRECQSDGKIVQVCISTTFANLVDRVGLSSFTRQNKNGIWIKDGFSIRIFFQGGSTLEYLWDQDGSLVCVDECKLEIVSEDNYQAKNSDSILLITKIIGDA